MSTPLNVGEVYDLFEVDMGEISQLYYNIGECEICGKIRHRNPDDLCEKCQLNG